MLIDKTSSIYLYVKLKATASDFFLVQVFEVLFHMIIEVGSRTKDRNWHPLELEMIVGKSDFQIHVLHKCCKSEAHASFFISSSEYLCTQKECYCLFQWKFHDYIDSEA